MKTTKTVLFDKSDVGCILDRSAFSADDCNKDTVRYANAMGGKIETQDKEFFKLRADGDSEYSEMLSYAGGEAIDYLNTLTSDDVYFEFDDNSLFLRLADDN
jgi:hypothetical protein